MYKITFIKLSLLFIFLFAIRITAQDPPIEWGIIPKSDLEMKSYPNDTNATAVILCDYGFSKVGDDLNVIFKRHTRIKILSTKGFDWGTYYVTVNQSKSAERISDIKGVTYNLDENGKVNKTKLSKKDIYKEEIRDGVYRYKFAMPSIKPGSVIEIQYEINGKNLHYMKNWVFQHSEPTLWSEYRVLSPTNIAYSAVTRGYEQFFVNETIKMNQVYSGLIRSYTGMRVLECNQMRWVVKDAPAIRDEPFITTTDDYVNKVELQLAGYSFNMMTEHILQNWSTFVNELLESKYFGEKIEDTRKVKKLAELLTQDMENPEEKVEAIYNWIITNIRWNNIHSIFADYDANEILDRKEGDVSEINFLLISMLKSIGIESDPVILSTRTNGQVQTLYPIVDQFNYVIARVKIGYKYLLIDATDPLRPMEMLPKKCLNVKGLIVKKDAYKWINIGSDKQETIRTLVNIYLNNDGSITGNFTDQYLEYSALRLRELSKNENEEDILKKIYDIDKNELVLDSTVILGKDSIHKPFVIKANFAHEDYAFNNEDILYITPQIIHKVEENPFQSSMRKYPIDFSHQYSYTIVTNLFIPDGYRLKEDMNDLNFTAAKGKIKYTRKFNTVGNQIQILSKYYVKAVEIDPVYYEQLKEFYSRMIAAQSEQIVLEKISEEQAINKSSISNKGSVN